MTVKHNSDWPSIAGLLGYDVDADMALIGAPMTLGAVSDNACDKAPGVVRSILSRISTYDLEKEIELAGRSIFDAGDVPIVGLSPAEGFAPLVKAIEPLVTRHPLTAILGGHNGITRAGVHGVDTALESVGVLTMDAHFDLRPTAQGLINGNPISALLEDGLSGNHIAQIGLAPFANSKAMHDLAKTEEISVYTMADCRERGLDAVISEALDRLSDRCEYIYVDFDIDVIDRALSPGATGGRSGGMTPAEFFAATRLIASHQKVCAVDLTEFDPNSDIGNITALIAGRWLAELLAGLQLRDQEVLN